MESALERALVIDDEAGMRNTLSFGLAQNGYQVDDAENAIAGLLKLEDSFRHNTPYQYIISDIILPDINGLKLLEVIKSKHPQLPVIMISGHGTEETSDEVTSRSGDAYLQKPFLMDELVQVIEGIHPTRVKAPTPVEDVTPSTSTSMYVLIKVDESVNPMTVYQKLYMMDNVLYCDAVRDDFDIILLINGESKRELEKMIHDRIATMENIIEIEWLPLVETGGDSSIQDCIKAYENRVNFAPGIEKLNNLRHSLLGYVLLEVDPLRLTDIYPRLYFLDNVISCDFTRGRYQLVLLVYQSSFTGLSRFIQEKIRPIDGVRRSKLFNVINVMDR